MKKGKKYDPINATPEETARKFNKNLDGIMPAFTSDLDEIDRQAGRDYAKKELAASKERFNQAADDEIAKEEDRQAEKIARKVLVKVHEALGLYLHGRSSGFPSGDGES